MKRSLSLNIRGIDVLSRLSSKGEEFIGGPFVVLSRVAATTTRRSGLLRRLNMIPMPRIIYYSLLNHVGRSLAIYPEVRAHRHSLLGMAMAQHQNSSLIVETSVIIYLHDCSAHM